MITNPSLVSYRKETDTFSISIEGNGSIANIPAEILPDLLEQLSNAGQWLSCYSYMYANRIPDSETKN